MKTRDTLPIDREQLVFARTGSHPPNAAKANNQYQAF